MTMNDKEATSTEVEAAEVLVEAQNAKSETPNTCKLTTSILSRSI